jgi:hypothetical protein
LAAKRRRDAARSAERERLISREEPPYEARRNRGDPVSA